MWEGSMAADREWIRVTFVVMLLVICSAPLKSQTSDVLNGKSQRGGSSVVLPFKVTNNYFPTNSFRQIVSDSVQIEWTRKYSSDLLPGTIQPNAVTADAAGNVYVSGKTDEPGTSRDYITIKYNSTGIKQWDAKYNGPGNGYDISNAIAVDEAGSVYVTGLSMGDTTSGYDVATIKYNAAGVQQWVARYNGHNGYYQNNDAGLALALDQTGNVYVTGDSHGATWYQDCVTIKYDANGNQLWVARLSGPGETNNAGFKPVVDAQGNIYVGGTEDNRSTTHAVIAKYNSSGGEEWIRQLDSVRVNDIAIDDSANVYAVVSAGWHWWFTGPSVIVVKYNKDGVKQWQTSYQGHSNDFATTICLDRNGDVIVAGGHWWSSSLGDSLLTVKFSSSGALLWARYQHGPKNCVAKGLSVDNSNNVYIVGSFGNAHVAKWFTSDSVLTVKYDAGGNLQWVRYFDDTMSSTEVCAGLAVDQDGNVIISVGYGTGLVVPERSSLVTIKYNSLGQVQWETHDNGQSRSQDIATAMVTDKSGNVYVTGTYVEGNKGFDYQTAKYSSTGDLLWVRREEGERGRRKFPTSIALDDENNVIITGVKEDMITGFDFVTIKYDQNGDKKWSARYDSPTSDQDFAASVIADVLGSVYVTGSSGDASVLIKYNQLGVQQWVGRYNNLNGQSAAIDSNGNVYVLGGGNSGGITLIKYDGSGQQQWLVQKAGSYPFPCAGPKIDNAGNIYFTGGPGTFKFSPTGVEQWVRQGGVNLALDHDGFVYVRNQEGGLSKFNSGGLLQWSVIGVYADRTYLKVDGEGNSYLVGENCYGCFPYMFPVVSYNSSGVLRWSQEFPFPESFTSTLNNLAVGESGSVYAGGTEMINGQSRMMVVKFRQVLTSALDEGRGLPDVYSLEQNYPNPFNPSTAIEYRIPKAGHVSLKVYTILGQEAVSLVDEFQSAGTYRATLNGSSLSSGVYLYRLNSGSFSETKKMLLVK